MRRYAHLAIVHRNGIPSKRDRESNAKKFYESLNNNGISRISITNEISNGILIIISAMH